jgi:hypothetical protein
MRRIKAVASPSQLCLWDELDEPAVFRREEVAPSSCGGGGAPPATAVPVAARPEHAQALPEGTTP